MERELLSIRSMGLVGEGKITIIQEVSYVGTTYAVFGLADDCEPDRGLAAAPAGSVWGAADWTKSVSG